MRGLQGACLQPNHRAFCCMGAASMPIKLLHLAECAAKRLPWLHHGYFLVSPSRNHQGQRQPVTAAQAHSTFV